MIEEILNRPASKKSSFSKREIIEHEAESDMSSSCTKSAGRHPDKLYIVFDSGKPYEQSRRVSKTEYLYFNFVKEHYTEDEV